MLGKVYTIKGSNCHKIYEILLRTLELWGWVAISLHDLIPRKSSIIVQQFVTVFRCKHTVALKIYSIVRGKIERVSKDKKSNKSQAASL